MELRTAPALPAKRYLNASELAGYIGKSKWWVYEKVKNREIPFMFVGKQARFDVKSIDQWLSRKLIPAVEVHQGGK